ncbi:hypothetical protein IEO21_06099 [Rhodonia placenta]|uniref:Cytochrome P450 n=1 Tax=Rhodonia placenta TaxID=104341 RepID=A0A8H7U1H0_9APHY|nr:hypothetical protein IEO21_06099 [Postia placenta]
MPPMILAVAFTAFCILLLARLAKRRSAALPPGPQGWPIIGNALDFPTSHQWKTFAQWGDRWGDIMSVSLLGRPVVVLNSFRLASEMLEKKSSIYSDRPTFVVAGEMVGWDHIGSQIQYGPRLRETRRLLSQFMGSRDKALKFASHIEAETHRFLSRVLYNPETLVAQIRKTAASTILMMAYGYTVQEVEDPLIQVAERAISDASQALTPANFFVDMFPKLRHVPQWVPGFGWKKGVAKMADTLTEMREMPFEFVKKQLAAGTAAHSFTSKHLEGPLSPEREQLIKDTASALYVGGSDTTVSTIASFFLAMMRNPEVQKRAQAEIDAIIGNDRLPALADRSDLPYVNALCSEVMRMCPSAPIAFPHVLSEDDIHAGYVLPKGTMVIANIWKFAHDPRLYSNPWEFNPDRFIATDKKPAEQDPHDMVFGFGRRFLAGMHFADAAVFMTCAMSLAVFDITKPVVDDVIIEPAVEMSSGIISHPLPFQCSIKPRSAKAESLILNTNELQA